MQELNALLTKDEKQIQFAIQVIKCYPYIKRETLVKGLGPLGSPKRKQLNRLYTVHRQYAHYAVKSKHCYFTIKID